jgi:hypothetical protein
MPEQQLVEIARSLGAAATASLLHDHALEGVANGMGDLDWSSLAKVAAMNAGLK